MRHADPDIPNAPPTRKMGSFTLIYGDSVTIASVGNHSQSQPCTPFTAVGATSHLGNTVTRPPRGITFRVPGWRHGRIIARTTLRREPRGDSAHTLCSLTPWLASKSRSRQSLSPPEAHKAGHGGSKNGGLYGWASGVGDLQEGVSERRGTLLSDMKDHVLTTFRGVRELCAKCEDTCIA